MMLSSLSAVWRKQPRFLACLLATGCLLSIGCFVDDVLAEPVTFTLVQEESFLTVSGTFDMWEFEPQSTNPASDKASYMGEIIVDVDDPAAPTQIMFLEATMEADITGDWLPAVGGGDVGDENIQGDANPGDPAPASYGLYLDAGVVGVAWGAFRDLVISISTLEPQVVTNGIFSDGQTMNVTQGTWDTTVRSGPLQAVPDATNSDDVTGSTADNLESGTYTVQGEVAKITLPVFIEFPGTTDLFFEGTIVATASLAAPIPGDFNGNEVLDVGDINKLTQQVILGTNDLNYDLNADNLVNDSDRTVWVKDLRQTWFGDADLNGAFDSNDFVQVFSVGKYETKTSAGWEEGDWDGNGVFDSGDFVRAFQDGGYELAPAAAAATVPEPATISLLLLAVTGLLLRRRPG